MRDKAGKTLKAYWKNDLYTVGKLSVSTRQVQLAMPVSDDSLESYCKPITVNVGEVIFTLE